MPDWITQFISATSTIRSPESFRLWSGIGTIAAIIERRAWTMTDVRPLYPNLYTFMVGLPASGKTNAVMESRKILASTVYLGPDNPSKASFLDELQKSGKLAINGSAEPIHSAMTVLCEEFGVLIPTYDDSFFADLAKIYDNPPMYSSPRRTTTSLKIEAPTLNILACATPAAIGKLPESAWGEGCTSRIIFIYGIKPPEIRDAFKKRPDYSLKDLYSEAARLYKEIHGEFDWEEPARQAFNSWFNSGMKPVPIYGRLVNYNGRRDTHVMKLAMISAVSAGNGLTVTINDFNRAVKWLTEAETTMPDVFRAITQKSDMQLLQDLHHVMYVEYSKVARSSRRPLPERFLWKFFEDRATSDKIPSLITAAEKAGYIRRSGLSGEWIPNDLSQINEGTNL